MYDGRSCETVKRQSWLYSRVASLTVEMQYWTSPGMIEPGTAYTDLFPNNVIPLAAFDPYVSSSLYANWINLPPDAVFGPGLAEPTKRDEDV